MNASLLELMDRLDTLLAETDRDPAEFASTDHVHALAEIVRALIVRELTR